MKTLRFFYLWSFLSIALIAMSCSSDDNDPISPPEPEPPSETELALEGQWQFEKLNFLNPEDIALPSADAAPALGYAPIMFGGMQGFYFGDDEVEGPMGEGKLFDYINEGDYNQDPESKYWFWNYTDDGKGFEIQQLNSSMPPYDFSIMEIEDIKLEEEGDKIVFKAKITTQEIGGGFTDKIETPVEITITRGAPTTLVQVLNDGEPFDLADYGEGETDIRSALVGKSWMLKPGSEVYDPGFSDQDPDKEYLKVVALNLTDDDILRYRYSFPAGIVTTKEFEQDALDDGFLKTKHGGGQFGGDEQIIEWEILDLTEDELHLKETQSGETRIFVKIGGIEDDEVVDKDNYTIIDH